MQAAVMYQISKAKIQNIVTVQGIEQRFQWSLMTVLPTGQELRFLEKVYMISYAQTHFLVVISRKAYHSQLPEPFWQISQNTPVKDKQKQHYAIS